MTESAIGFLAATRQPVPAAPSALLVRLARLIDGYAGLQADGVALSDQLTATGQPYDLPAAKRIEHRLAAWAASAEAVLAEAGASEDAARLSGLLTEFRDMLYTARSALLIPVERAAASADRIARDGFAGAVTTEDLRRERLHDRVGA